MEERIEAYLRCIGAAHPTGTLHVFNGSAQLRTFRNRGLLEGLWAYATCNEALCWGRVAGAPFSAPFIASRVSALETTPQAYAEIVLEPLAPLFRGAYEAVALWFGGAMFCQMNLLALLAYLEERGFGGAALFCPLPEGMESPVPGAAPEAIALGPYRGAYVSLLVEGRLPACPLPPLMARAAERYLTYRTPAGPIVPYIRAHLDREDLVERLLARFPEYGLGDLQYLHMIREIRAAGGD